MLPLAPDQLTLGEKFAQIIPNPAFHDLPETLMIFFDLEDHEFISITSAQASRGQGPRRRLTGADSVHRRPSLGFIFRCLPHLGNNHTQ